MNERHERDYFRQDVITLAKCLLGQRLVRLWRGQRLAGIIVETEAYLGVNDRAAHTFGGRRTARNHSMWMDGGHAYVYFTYGMHYCLNIVGGKVDEPVAVLIRAIQPTEGLKLMERFRGSRKTVDLCSGPAKLCQALSINRAQDGVDLVNSDALFLECQKDIPAKRIQKTARVGVSYAEKWAMKPLRYVVRGSAYVSGARPVRNKPSIEQKSRVYSE